MRCRREGDRGKEGWKVEGRIEFEDLEVARREGEEGPDESSADDREGEVIVQRSDVCEEK